MVAAAAGAICAANQNAKRLLFCGRNDRLCAFGVGAKGGRGQCVFVCGGWAEEAEGAEADITCYRGGER